MINYETIKNLTNVELLDSQKELLEQIENRNFVVLKGDRNSGRSYLLAVYALLSMLHPFGKRKIVVTGPTFRQVRTVSSYLHGLLEYMDVSVKIAKESDRDSYIINGNSCVFTPMGTGERIRGLRPNILIVDDADYVPKDIADTVAQGFAAVAANPIDIIRESPPWNSNQIIYMESK